MSVITPHFATQSPGMMQQKLDAAIINTGIFPAFPNSMRLLQGLSSSMSQTHSFELFGVGVRWRWHVTVMRTTFLGLLQRPLKPGSGQWQEIKHSEREVWNFSPMVEPLSTGLICEATTTLPDTFPVKTVITKFGSVPDF